MTDYQGIENRLTEQLNLERRPIAITFRETPPPGVPKFTGSEPSGCSFWRLAGNRVYTGLDDGEMYVAIPGKDLDLVADQIQTIGAANATLFEYHRDRRLKLSTD